MNEVQTEYYENGQKKSEVTYKDGEREGLSTYWYENGQKKSEVTYKDGKEEGIWTSWYANGQKRNEINHKNGETDGLWTSWYKNGQNSDEINHKNGVIDGLWTSWFENGEKEFVKTYKNGMLILSSGNKVLHEDKRQKVESQKKVHRKSAWVCFLEEYGPLWLIYIPFLYWGNSLEVTNLDQYGAKKFFSIFNYVAFGVIIYELFDFKKRFNRETGTMMRDHSLDRYDRRGSGNSGDHTSGGGFSDGGDGGG